MCRHGAGQAALARSPLPGPIVFTRFGHTPIEAALGDDPVAARPSRPLRLPADGLFAGMSPPAAV